MVVVTGNDMLGLCWVYWYLCMLERNRKIDLIWFLFYSFFFIHWFVHLVTAEGLNHKNFRGLVLFMFLLTLAYSSLFFPVVYHEQCKSGIFEPKATDKELQRLRQFLQYLWQKPARPIPILLSLLQGPFFFTIFFLFYFNKR